MRRREDEGDGLDLLLDAICNIFGLFIFVAMLVALIVSVRGTEAKPDEAPPATQALVSSRASEIESLEALIASFDLASLEAGDEAVERARTSLEAAELELLRREASLEAIRSRLADLERRKAERGEDRPRLEAEIRRLEEEIASVRETRDVTVRTPRRRELSGRVPAQLVLWRGRAYLLNDWSTPDAHPCDSWTTWNDQAVDAARSEAVIHYCWRAGGQHIDRAAYLRPDGGVAVPEGGAAVLERSREWRRSLAGLDPARHVVSIKADADSFEAFAAVRAAIARRGFLYDVAPVRIEPATGLYQDTILEGRTTAQ